MKKPSNSGTVRDQRKKRKMLMLSNKKNGLPSIIILKVLSDGKEIKLKTSMIIRMLSIHSHSLEIYLRRSFKYKKKTL